MKQIVTIVTAMLVVVSSYGASRYVPMGHSRAFLAQQKASLEQKTAFKAVLAGDLDTITLLLDNGLSIDIKDKELESTLLHHAAETGHLHIVRFLLSRGARVDAINRAHLTPLRMTHDPLVMQVLLEAGAGVHTQDVRRATPLHGAARMLKSAAAEVLLQNGADVHAQDQFGLTPLALGSPSSAQLTVKVLVAGALVPAMVYASDVPKPDERAFKDLLHEYGAER